MECLRLFAVQPSSSFGTADAFLHSPPMVESSARSTRPRLFLRCVALHHDRRRTASTRATRRCQRSVGPRI